MRRNAGMHPFLLVSHTPPHISKSTGKNPRWNFKLHPTTQAWQEFFFSSFMHIRWLKQKSTSVDFVNSYSLSHFGICELFLGCPTTKRVRVDRTFHLRHTFQKKCIPSVHFSIRLEYHEIKMWLAVSIDCQRYIFGTYLLYSDHVLCSRQQ